jgi:hypothetical protein
MDGVTMMMVSAVDEVELDEVVEVMLDRTSLSYVVVGGGPFSGFVLTAYSFHDGFNIVVESAPGCRVAQQSSSRNVPRPYPYWKNLEEQYGNFVPLLCVSAEGGRETG